MFFLSLGRLYFLGHFGGRFVKEILRLNLTVVLELGFPFLDLRAQVLDVFGKA